MELSAFDLKIIILFCFLIMTFLFGMVPMVFYKFFKKASDQASIHDPISSAAHEEHLNKLHKYKRAMSFLSCFAAGVFLATCFLELLPDVQNNLLHILMDEEHNLTFKGFPAAEFVMVLGLFIILVVEQIVLTIKEGSGHHHHHHDYHQIPGEDQPILSRSHQHHSRDAQVGLEEAKGDQEFVESFQSDHSLGGICDEPHISSNDVTSDVHGSLDSGNHYQRRFSRQSSVGSHIHSHIPRHDHYPSHSVSDENSIKSHSKLRAMLLLCALSLHSVFEGITVGLLTDKEKILSIFAALTVHKSILSFSLGMNLVQSRISIMSAIKSIVGFSVAAPVGLLIGVAITDFWTSTNSGIVHGILQGIASGTFLYIIFFEILPKEFNCETDRILKVLFLIIGYATVTGVLFLSDEMKEPICKVMNDVGN